METTNFNLLVNHKVNASVNLQKSFNSNVQSIIDLSTAKKDRQVVKDSANEKRFSLSETVKILSEQLETANGEKMLNSNLFTKDFFNVKNVLKAFDCFSDTNYLETLEKKKTLAIELKNKKLAIELDGKIKNFKPLKTPFLIVAKTDKNEFLNTKNYKDFSLNLSIATKDFLYRIDDDGFLILLKDKIEYTVKIVDKFTFEMVFNKLTKFKRELLKISFERARIANLDKITLEKETLAKEKKEKLAKEKQEKQEKEKLELSEKLARLEYLESLQVKNETEAETLAEKLANVA